MPSRLNAAQPITALIYDDGATAAQVLRAISAGLATAGIRCCGFIQQDEQRADRPRCDMYLIDIDSGERLKISEDRGPMARGCRLDSAELVRALGLARGMLAQGAEILVLNKYGKSESEGQGFRPLIADAIDRGIPILIGVPRKNVESWRQFAGELSAEHDARALASLSGDTAGRLVGLTIKVHG